MPTGPITPLGLITDFGPDWVSTAVAVLTTVAYVRVRRSAARAGLTWRAHRDVVFGLGMLAWFWTVAGFPQARSGQLMWVWTVQQLLLLLIVPVVVLAGQPLALVRRTSGERSRLLRVLGSGPVRVLGNPLIGPVLVPVVCFVLFFSGLGNSAAAHPLLGSALHLALLIVGGLIALPLVDTDDARSSLAIGLSLAVGFIELIVDAFPGIVLRFETHLTMPYFGVDRPAWAGSWLDDQHLAGGILWIVAELLDVPFLILAATRWIKADAREAAEVDAHLEARRTALRPADEPDLHPDAPVLDRPWWESDPELKARFRR